MFDSMRRLYPRGAASRGVSVDTDGAMLGPDCVLVRRASRGYQAIGRTGASAVQKCLLDADRDSDWLFRQCERIAEALNRGELALAQIYGLRIPIHDLDERQLSRITRVSGLFKAGFDPDEPRIPKGDPRGGQWTSEGGGGGSGDASVDVSGAGDAANVGPSGDTDVPGGAGVGGDGQSPSASSDGAGDASSEEEVPRTSDGSDAGDRPSMEYRWANESSNAAPSSSDRSISSDSSITSADSSTTSIAAPGMPSDLVSIGATAVEAEAASLLGELPAITEAALEQLAARLTAAAIVFRILFIPSTGGVIVEGSVAGAADLSYRYDRDTGALRIWQDDGSENRSLVGDGRIGLDGRFHDAGDNVIGRPLPDGTVIVDLDALAGYRSQSDTSARPQAWAQTLDEGRSEPKLCPDPTPENIAGRSERAITYQTQITGLPPGLEIVFNGERYDGCRDSDGHLLEAKGEGYANMMLDPENWRGWFTGLIPLQEQMEEHSRKAAGRIVEYYFAEKDVSEYFRQYAQRMRLDNIIVYHVPAERRK